MTADKDIDPITQQASQLEAQLSKMRNTSPEAAEVMLKLIDLYHENGRVFGLVRVSQSFVALHTTHPKHRDAMLKLIDGLQATARNKELVATIRQFLVRQPKDQACPTVERLLARLLIKAGDTTGAAAVNESRWRRLGATEEGRDAGVHGHVSVLRPEQPRWLHQSSDPGRGDARQAAGRRAGDLGRLENHRCLGACQQLGQGQPDGRQAAPEESAARFLAGGTAPPNGRELRPHRPACQRHRELPQGAGPCSSGRTCTAGWCARSTPRIPSRRTSSHWSPSIYQKYPTREDRFALRTLVGLAYQSSGDKARAEQIFAEVMPFDARSHGPVSSFVSLISKDPARIAQAEQVLLDAHQPRARPR